MRIVGAAAVAEATTLPCILYLRRDVFSERDFAHLIGHPKVLGMKFAVPDAVKLAERVRQCAPLNKIAVCGLAEPWAPAMAASVRRKVRISSGALASDGASTTSSTEPSGCCSFPRKLQP